MRPDAVVVLVRMVAGAILVVRMVGLGRRQVLVIARVRRRSGATAHHVLSNERNEHHP